MTVHIDRMMSTSTPRALRCGVYMGISDRCLLFQEMFEGRFLFHVWDMISPATVYLIIFIFLILSLHTSLSSVGGECETCNYTNTTVLGSLHHGRWSGAI